MATKLNRRDRCFCVGRRMSRLPPDRAALAWSHLAASIEAMGDPMARPPKFNDLRAIRQANIAA